MSFYFLFWCGAFARCAFPPFLNQFAVLSFRSILIALAFCCRCRGFSQPFFLIRLIRRYFERLHFFFLSQPFQTPFDCESFLEIFSELFSFFCQILRKKTISIVFPLPESPKPDFFRFFWALCPASSAVLLSEKTLCICFWNEALPVWREFAFQRPFAALPLSLELKLNFFQWRSL